MRSRSELAVHAVVVLSWAVLPITGGEAVADAVADADLALPVAAAVFLWAWWGATLLALLVPRTVSLTLARIGVPAAPVAIAGAVAATGDVGIPTAVGLTASVVATAVVLTAPIGHRFANGSAYGAEARYPLRPPIGLLLGPLPLTWLVVTAGVAAGPLLLAGGVWWAAVVATVVGWPAAWFATRTAHQLARRWLVLVPAGLVVHDPLAMADSLLATRTNLVHVRPAPVDSEAFDLTMGATGLALEVTLVEPQTILTQADRRSAGGSLAATRKVAAVLVMPSRPGAVLRSVAERRLPIA
ncbi:MAG: hypothetical protein JJU45_09460 [Acidimicrobiia bacterium]|nr:hypothetical protein [Acidimicrobiia bacterium]